MALIGNNGSGKTTILKIINDLLPAEEGEIRTGSNVQIGYYDQEHHVLHPEKTLFEEISDAYPTLNNTEIRNTLAAFLFTGEDVFKLVRELSGGERGESLWPNSCCQKPIFSYWTSLQIIWILCPKKYWKML